MSGNRPRGLDLIQHARCTRHVHKGAIHFAPIKSHSRLFPFLPGDLASRPFHKRVGPNELRTNEPKKLFKKVGRPFAGFQPIANISPCSLDRSGPFLIYWVIVVKIRFAAHVIVNAERAEISRRGIVHNEFAASLSAQILAREAPEIRSWNEMIGRHCASLTAMNICHEYVMKSG
jgi:hypothetical protein